MKSLRVATRTALSVFFAISVLLPCIVSAQGVRSTSRELYDNDALFNQLSSAFQMKLEQRYGKKNGTSVAPQLTFENKSYANGPREGFPSLSALANTLVNDATADATVQDTQSETALVLGSGSDVIAGFNDSGSFIGGASKFTGFSTSANSGSTFTDGGTLPTNAWGDAGDPVLARSTLTGTVFLSTLGFITDDVIPIFRSSNDGVSWQAPVNGAPTPAGTGSAHDKEWIVVDNFAGTGQGNVYMAWRNFGSTSNGILFTRSTDDGATWGPSGGLNLSANGGQGAFVAVAPNHDVYAFWYHSLTTPQEIRVRRSTDRGVTFGSPATVTTLKTRGVNGDFGLEFRSNAFPQAAINPASGYLYVVYPDSVGDGSDRCSVYFKTSTDNGVTWSLPTTLTSFYDQFNPAITIRPDGSGLSVSWYDRSSDAANYYIERWGRNATISGTTVTWGPPFKISESFGPVYGVDPVVNGLYMGDYDQMAADNSYYYTTWGDNRDQSVAAPARKNANVRFAKYPAGVFLDLTGYQVSGGNGNGLIDADECNSLQVSLINNAGATLTGVSGTLTSLTPGVRVSSSTQPFTDIVPGGIVANSVPFSLSTVRSLLGGTPINLQLNVTSSGGSQTLNFVVATGGYTFGTSTGSIVPGTTDIGNHLDDGVTPVLLPFPIKFYNQTYTTAYASSNGNIQFESNSTSFNNPCPPVTFFKTAIMPYFDDLTLFTAGDGIFTLVEGTAPNRIFDMEWRAHTFSGGLPVNFEVRFFENTPNFVSMVYGTVVTGGNSATVGMQFGTTYFSQFSCNTASLSNGLIVNAAFPTWGEGNGACLPPTMAVTPASLSFTVPQNGSSGNVVRVSNTAAAGNDDLSYSVGDYTGSLVLSSGRTIPIEVRRLMGVFPEKMPHDEAMNEAAGRTLALRASNERAHAALRPEETATGHMVPPGATIPSSNPIAIAPYVETFESGNFNGWFNEGFNATAQVVSGTAGEGTRSFQTSASTFSHFTSIRQDWTGGAQPGSIGFFVRPTTTTNNQGYAVFTTGGSANTEVIWFYCDATGKFYVNQDVGGDNSFVYTAGTWYRVEFRNINWTAKTLDYYVNGSLIKPGVPMRNSGIVSNIDRVHLYNFDPGAIAQWDGIRVGGASGDNAWLSEPATGGTVSPGAYAQVLVNVNATGLSPGGYTGTLVVSGNDPANPSLTVPVTLTVTPPVAPPEFAVVSNINDNTINIIDIPNNASYGPYLSGSLGAGSLTDVEVTPDHNTALIASFGEHRIYFVDVSNPAVPAVLGNALFTSMGSTEDLAITSNGRFALATGGSGNTFIGVVDIASRTVVQELNIGPRTAEAVAVAANGTVLVADYPNNSVHVLTINPTTGILTDLATAIGVGIGPVNVGISPDGQTALVSNFFGNSISVLRITGVGTVSLTSTIPNLNFPAPTAFRPDGARAYVALNGSSPDSIAVLQVTGPGNVSNTGLRAPLVSDIDGGYYGIDGIAVAYSGNWAYVGDVSSGGSYTPLSASAVNLATNSIGFSLPTGSIPTGVAIGGKGGPAGTSFSTVLNVFDNCNTIGMALGTGTGLSGNYDAGFDQFAPPAPPVGAFDARFRVTSPANDFLKDYRGPNTGVKIWDVYYAAASGCGNVTLACNIAQLPATGSFRLVDAFTGTLVNIDMRSQSFYTDTFPLGHLQIVYSLDASFTKSVAANWNLLGLPNVVADPYYLSVFPSATPGTLFGFNGSYFLTDTLKAGIGYWLRFGAPISQPIPGVFRNSTSNSMVLGWNLIAGPSCDIPLSTVSDPGGIIIPGTLFGFNGAYVLSDTLKAGNGYWLRTTAAGSISTSCGSTTRPLGKVVAKGPDVSAFPSLQIADASHAIQTLYTSVKLENDAQMLSFSMPPVPPAGNFDARFVGDYRASTSNGGLIQVQSANYPVTITCPNTPANSSVDYVVEEMMGKQEGRTYKLSMGSSVEIRNPLVNMLRLAATSSEVPASFAVDQNYPNPFNPTTEIAYALPQDAFVTITVFNSLGQTVKTLVSDQQKAGYYRTRWEGDNNSGQKVGSGVYFYKVNAGTFTSTRKMLLLK